VSNLNASPTLFFDDVGVELVWNIKINIKTIEDKTLITLKDICDILEVRHNNAMRTVLTLSKEPSFGWLLQTST
tara:strand:- start:3598 stop:3819 length:222 start_codon:yes stop_codon:yes gene_type:complete